MSTDILKRVKGYFEEAVQAPAYRTWLADAKKAWAFYDGEQWTADEVQKLEEYGQAPIVINKIAPKVDNVAGTEIASRTRIIYRSRSGEAGEEETAKALSDLALYVAERSEQAIELSNMFKAGLITGVAWLDVGIEDGEEGAVVFNRYENEMQVVWDSAATRQDYSDARFVCRERWLDEEEVKRLFPETADSLLSTTSAEERTRFGARPLGEDVIYFNSDRKLWRVIEVQYKQTEKLYRVRTVTGEPVLTFDKAEARQINAEDTLDVTYAPRVHVAYYSGNVLLGHEPLPYLHNRFTLIPYLFKRDRKTGAPYGLVRTAIDPQRELNKRRSKAMHLLNTAQVIADVDAVDDPDMLAREAARPDGMILKRPGKDLRIIRNTDLAASQVSVMEKAALDIQEVMGVFDEAIGRHTNATSGVAIQTRQMASNTNQMFAFDALRRTKKMLGLTVLALIRQYFTNEMTIQITDNLSAPRLVRLNQPLRDEQGNTMLRDDGKPVILNDVRTGIFDIHVEEVTDALSSRELELSQLQLLMQAGVPVPPQMLVEASTLRNKEQLIRELDGQAQPSASKPL
ncbi:MAG: hypothetical protein GC134_01870 [Proteobacteria bacterium]|nr:hypothetical protein [Pseudomonadota bacterium]